MIISEIPGDKRSRGLLAWLTVARRRKYWILGATLLGLAVATAFVSLRPLRYTSEAVLALDARIPAQIPERLLSRLPQESAVVRTELDVVSSRSMAEKVLTRLNSTTPSEKTPPWRQWLTKVAKSALPGVFPEDRAARIESPAKQTDNRDMVNELLDGLRVANDGRSYTIFISYTARDPVFAAAAANAFASIYLDQQTASQAAAATAANEWLGTKVNQLRIELDRAEQAIQAYRRETRQFLAKGNSPTEQRVAALNHELGAARAAKADAEAKLRTAKTLSQTEAGLEAFGDVLRSDTIQTLRNQLAEITRTLDGFDEVGLNVGPQLTLMRSKRLSIKKQIKEETYRIQSSLASQVEVAQLKEQQLAAMVEAFESQLATESAVQLRLAQLEREASASRTIYETLLSRYKQTIEQERLAAPEARLLSWATLADQPTDRVLPLLILGLLGGAAMGLGCALLRESLDDRVRSAEELEDLSGLPVLGMIPTAKPQRWWAPRLRPDPKPYSTYSETFGRLAAVVRLSPALKAAQVVMITSSVPNEGKTAACVSLARSMALTGKKVIVVDTDLHRPGVAAAFQISANSSLSSLVLGEKTVDQAVRLDSGSSVSVIPTESVRHESTSVLGSEEFRLLIGNLRQRFDIIILDTPPLDVSSEAALVGRVADATLLVVRLGGTSKEQITSGLRHLALCGVSVSGTLIGGVDNNHRMGYEPRHSQSEAAAARHQVRPSDWNPSPFQPSTQPSERSDPTVAS